MVMENSEISNQIEKIKFHIGLLADAIDYQAHPVELLVVSKDWSREDLDAAHDIFDKWDKIIRDGGKINHREFEFDFQDKLGVGYQGVKSVVNAFYKNDQWTDVCEAFVDSMGPHPSVEYLAIARREK